MLRFVIGRAGAGKTAALIREIQENMARGIGGNILLVPEQYSHEAERELCRVCGDSLSLYAEVLSFSGLARSLETRRGGAANPWLDQGGRMLCMALALQGVGARLKVYGAAQRRAEMQAMLLRAVDELKTARIDAELLSEAAAACPDTLGDKLRDLALVLEAYEGVVTNGRADPADRLTRLAEAIDSGGLDGSARVYVDGFIDFTRQEQAVLCAMLRQGIRLTVCLTVDDLDGENEIFEEGLRLDKLVQPEKVVTKEENIAGVKIPSFEELTFKDIEYNVDDYPLWVDTAVFKLREIARLDALVATFRKQVQLLEAELRTTSQRVNLFEKVKIPEAKENIRVIQVFIGDQQTAAVVRGKIAKKKLVEV